MLGLNIPIDTVYYMVIYYFKTQMASITWKGARGVLCYVEEGVTQGGVLSPFLFQLYIDKVLFEISNMSQGCMIGASKINIL